VTSKLFRDLTRSERAILDCLLDHDFPGRDEIAQQLVNCSVRVIDENGSLEFQINSPIKASSVRSRVPTEGEAEDSDGVIIHFLLHVVDGVLRELEIYKEDNSTLLAMPDINAIRVFAPP
jgi:hypothetical protein